MSVNLIIRHPPVVATAAEGQLFAPWLGALRSETKSQLKVQNCVALSKCHASSKAQGFSIQRSEATSLRSFARGVHSRCERNWRFGGRGYVDHRGFAGEAHSIGGLRRVEVNRDWVNSSGFRTMASIKRDAAMASIKRDEVGPGQESVWDYPRPPRLEPVQEKIKIVFNGETIAETTSGYRVLETSHPPVYYISPADIKMDHITRAMGRSFCEWKGDATWWSVSVGAKTAEKVAWSYESPTRSFLPIKGYVAFYAGPTDACYLGEEKAQPQPGNFYGGWVTSKIVGPFKGGTGSYGW